jgi:predicted transcriptional regulator
MMLLNKNRLPGREQAASMPRLGPLEANIMEILWSWHELSVRGVVHKLERPLAYTTVMTTLDRLYKKGLLDRRKCDRAFHYAPRISREEWEQRRAGDFVDGFLGDRGASRNSLISCLVEAVGQHDALLLEELESKIRLKRKELARRGRP